MSSCAHYAGCIPEIRQIMPVRPLHDVPCKNLNARAHAQLSTRAGTFFRVEFKLDTAAVKLVIFSASCKSVLPFFYLTAYGSICQFFFLCLFDCLYMKTILGF